MELGAFTKSLAFGALAALATTPFVLLARPLVGGASAVALWSVLLTAAYLVCVAKETARGLRFGIAALALGLLVLGTASATTTVLGSAAILAALRSAFLFRKPPARGLVVEAVLLLASSSLVQLFVPGSGGALGLAFGVWTFFLVQSLYFLVGGSAVAGSSGTHPEEDPFETAQRKAARLMDDWSPTS